MELLDRVPADLIELDLAEARLDAQPVHLLQICP